MPSRLHADALHHISASGAAVVPHIDPEGVKMIREDTVERTCGAEVVQGASTHRSG
jgi:hypothetical protein